MRCSKVIRQTELYLSHRKMVPLLWASAQVYTDRKKEMIINKFQPRIHIRHPIRVNQVNTSHSSHEIIKTTIQSDFVLFQPSVNHFIAFAFI